MAIAVIRRQQTVNISDGAIMFVACVLSFTAGYIIGAVRVARHVTKKLDGMKESMEAITKHAGELRQIYANLSDPKQ